MRGSIAVVGMACRFPGANTPSQFWRNLERGVESIATFSDAELLEAGVAPELVRHPQYVKAAAVLDGIDLFDAGFFTITPRDAQVLDVQHRLFLECAWEALEDACCMPERFAGAIGVYAGAGVNSYLLSNLLPNREAIGEVGEFQTLISNDKDYLPTRVSYKLNLRGPSISVQTACSTSLVAIHLACQSLLQGECDLALAGGVSLRVPQKVGYLYRDDMILSPDGHCRAFDARAAGTVAGSGVGIIVVKRLDDAIADGDTIHAVVAGSAVNNDGSLKVGYTAPSVEGQRAVIREALAVADLEAATIGFVETHGTGTPLGDPVEFAALAQAFKGSGACAGRCVLGSVKTNLGHLDAAAGVAGFIKAVLAIRHGRIPPTLHFTTANPQIPLAGSPFRINTTVEEWSANGGVRRAGVSSFGIGGTNAHVVLEQGPAMTQAPARGGAQLLVVSARSDASLAGLQAELSRAIDGDPSLAPDDVAASLMLGRRAFDHRAAVVTHSREQAARDVARAPRHVVPPAAPRLVFMFPGQGSPYVGMGAELYRVERVFRDALDQCHSRLAPLGFDLRAILFDSTDAELAQTSVAQPAIFAIEYALTRLLMSWGMTPDATIGHSVGELTAACIGGSIVPEDALSLIVERGRLMQEMPPGRMLAVRLPADLLGPELGAAVSIAAVNAPEWSVLSGPAEAVDALRGRLSARGVECQALQTSHAFHSAMMDPMLAAFASAASRVTFRSPSIRWVSNVTGAWITDAEAVDPGYWVRHLRAPVQFSAGLTALHDATTMLVEVGPGCALSTLARTHPGVATSQVVPVMRHPRDRSSEQEHLLRAVGALWTAGVAVDWSALGATAGRRRVSLPTTPFDRQRYWVDPPGPAKGGDRGSAAPGHDARENAELGFSVPVWTPAPPPAGVEAADRHWLFFARDDDEVVAALIARVTSAGRVTRVRPGLEYRRDAVDRFTIRPGVREDYDALLKEATARPAGRLHVVHAWAAGAEVQPQAATLDESLFSLIWLARALGSDDEADEVRLDVLSSQMQAVGGESSLAPARASLLGPVLVAPLELPAIRCRSIDYDAVRVTGRLVELLCDEIRAASADQIVAYRNHQRYTRRLGPLTLETSDRRIALKRRGHYLITGGLGGVGLVLAGHLASRYAARLTLVGRSPAAAHVLHAIERSGGRVCALTADVRDAVRLADAVRDAERRLGPIDGVVHAAGVPAGGVLLRKTRADIDAVIGAKIDGARNLAQIFEGAALDFMLFMSSVTALTGDVGQVDYCAANAFLDALAHQLRAAGQNVCSVNWDTWREAGMAVATRLPGVLQTLRDRRLQQGLGNDEGAHAFERALSSGLVQVVVSRRDLGHAATPPSLDEDLTRVAGEAPAAARYPRPALAVPFAAPESPEERTLCEIWEALLGIDAVGIHDDFFELGGHSLLATQLLSRVRDRMSVRLSLASFFEHGTVARLARLIEARQIDAVLADLDQLTEDEARNLLDQGQRD